MEQEFHTVSSNNIKELGNHHWCLFRMERSIASFDLVTHVQVEFKE